MSKKKEYFDGKRDIMDQLAYTRHQLKAILAEHFVGTDVDKSTPQRGVFFDHSKKEWLKEMGVLAGRVGTPGVFRPSSLESKARKSVFEADSLIWQISWYLREHRILPKEKVFSLGEMSRFKLIDFDRGSD